MANGRELRRQKPCLADFHFSTFPWSDRHEILQTCRTHRADSKSVFKVVVRPQEHMEKPSQSPGTLTARPPKKLETLIFCR